MTKYRVEYADGDVEVISAVSYDEACKHAKLRADYTFTSVMKVEVVR